MTKITKGMILAAGLGTRLRPVTLNEPKPLVPVLNIPNILYNVHLLKQAGITDIVINLHHLGEMLETFFKKENWGVNFHFSQEALLLGTGGGVKKAENFLKDDSFVLANCDFVTNVDLLPVIQKHKETQSLCTMVLLKDPLMQSFYSSVGVDSSGHLCSLPSLEIRVPSETGIFSGIHILEPDVFKYLEEKPSGINQVLYPALMKESPERLAGVFMKDFWFDTGDRYFLWLTSMKLLERMHQMSDPYVSNMLKTYGGYKEISKDVWVCGSASSPKDVSFIGPVVIGKDCEIGQGSQIGPYTVVGDGTKIENGSKLCRTVVLPNSEVEKNKHIEGGLIYGKEILSTKKLG